jgi:hypothetical protein
MVYKLALYHSDERLFITVSEPPGCCSQSVSEEESLANVANAIGENPNVVAELAAEVESREVEVEV